MGEVEIGGVRMRVVSRVCWRRTGTRFNCREIDREGFVTNFAEVSGWVLELCWLICADLWAG